MIEAITSALFGAAPERALPIFFLVIARAMPLAFAAPWLGWRGTAAFARIAVGLVISIALTPIAIATAPELAPGWLPLALMAVREALIGIAFAIASSIPLIALGWTGELIDRWRGSSEEIGPLGVLHLSAGVVLFVLVGGHRLALAAFADGLMTAPIGSGSASDLGSLALGAARLATMALSFAAVFALPAAVAFLVVELALGLASRAAPSLGSWFSALPLRAVLGVGIALLALSALLPELPPLFASSISAARDLLSQ